MDINDDQSVQFSSLLIRQVSTNGIDKIVELGSEPFSENLHGMLVSLLDKIERILNLS